MLFHNDSSDSEQDGFLKISQYPATIGLQDEETDVTLPSSMLKLRP
jgi:hypothetical protein